MVRFGKEDDKQDDGWKRRGGMPKKRFRKSSKYQAIRMVGKSTVRIGKMRKRMNILFILCEEDINLAIESKNHIYIKKSSKFK